MAGFSVAPSTFKGVVVWLLAPAKMRQQDANTRLLTKGLESERRDELDNLNFRQGE